LGTITARTLPDRHRRLDALAASPLSRSADSRDAASVCGTWCTYSDPSARATAGLATIQPLAFRALEDSVQQHEDFLDRPPRQGSSLFGLGIEWAGQDSNLRLTDYESAALTN
jgi:hypothetical protein